VETPVSSPSVEGPRTPQSKSVSRSLVLSPSCSGLLASVHRDLGQELCHLSPPKPTSRSSGFPQPLLGRKGPVLMGPSFWGFVLASSPVSLYSCLLPREPRAGSWSSRSGSCCPLQLYGPPTFLCQKLSLLSPITTSSGWAQAICTMSSPQGTESWTGTMQGWDLY
jgi:hypothetical protein